MNRHQIYPVNGKYRVFMIDYSNEIHIHTRGRILMGAQTRRRKGIYAPEEDEMRE